MAVGRGDCPRETAGLPCDVEPLAAVDRAALPRRLHRGRGGALGLPGVLRCRHRAHDRALLVPRARLPRGGPSVPGPPADVGSDQPTDPTSEVALPVVIFKVEPVYPPRAREDRIRGTVVCQAVVGDDGYVRDVKVLSSTNPIFNAASMRAVSQRRYLPAQRSRRAIAIYFTVTVRLRASSARSARWSPSSVGAETGADSCAREFRT